MKIRTLWGLPALGAVIAAGAALLAPPPARCAEPAAEHVVRPGDNLHLIAGYFYRDPRQWRRIRKLNRKAVSDPNHLVPGRVLQIELEPGLAWDIPYEEFLSRVRGR
jgi:nucleoid-associated protein YgaU